MLLHANRLLYSVRYNFSLRLNSCHVFAIPTLLDYEYLNSDLNTALCCYIFHFPTGFQTTESSANSSSIPTWSILQRGEFSLNFVEFNECKFTFILSELFIHLWIHLSQGTLSGKPLICHSLTCWFHCNLEERLKREEAHHENVHFLRLSVDRQYITQSTRVQS